MDTASPGPTELTPLLGQGTSFRGALIFDGRIRIDGAFEGTIRSDDMLVIGEGAEITAEIDVGTVVMLGGVVRGDIRARAAIELFVPATVVGNLWSPSIVIEKGVRVEGACRMAPVRDPSGAAET